MHKLFFLTILAGSVISCTQNTGNNFRKEVIAVVEEYAMNHLSDAKRSVNEDGIITLCNNGIMYRIDPSKIFIGEIDADKEKDAIITILVSRMPAVERPEHLILIRKESGFMIAKVIESDMKVLQIKDGIIFAEVSIVSPDSPIYGCESCKEVVHYHYRDGDLVRVE